MQPTESQSFLRVVALCWARPRLLLTELTWRWLCGCFLLVLFGFAAHRIALATAAQVQSTGLFNATIETTIQDPTQLSVAFTSTLAILGPWVLHAAFGLAPLALFAWVAAFAIGRSALLRQWDSAMPARMWLLAICEALRLLALVALSWSWYGALKWAASYALGPLSDVTDATGSGAQADPNLVLYCALVIIITLGLFTLWSLVSWSLVAAPLTALLEQVSFSQGFLRSVRRRKVRGQLLEVNLAMAVIKLGLLVLATVLSATPLPFESVMQGWPLAAWWILVTLLYLAASDFFKMVRLFAFLGTCRAAGSALAAEDQPGILGVAQNQDRR